MPRPNPTFVYHFTHVNHLSSILQRGLLADSAAHAEGLLAVEVGNVGIKERRQRRLIPIPPGGVVADYVPFYFAPRSPMMFAIEKSNVATYSGGCDELVYLVTTVERLCETDAPVLFTDRNAVLAFARFTDDVIELNDLVDWPLMKATYWANTPEDPDRKERRMAECLVHHRVPWSAVLRLAVRNETCAANARAMLNSLEVEMAVTVIPSWYF